MQDILHSLAPREGFYSKCIEAGGYLIPQRRTNMGISKEAIFEVCEHHGYHVYDMV